MADDISEAFVTCDSFDVSRKTVNPVSFKKIYEALRNG
jgi:hypothetical protein